MLDNPEGYRKIIENFLKREPEGFHVALIDDEVVGFSVSHRDALGSNYKTTQRIGTVQIIHTKRTHRRKGVAKQLLENALKYLRDNNCAIILAETDQQKNASMSFLEKNGFKQRGNHVTLIRVEKPSNKEK